jgi:hypothetical protein
MVTPPFVGTINIHTFFLGRGKAAGSSPAFGSAIIAMRAVVAKCPQAAAVCNCHPLYVWSLGCNTRATASHSLRRALMQPVVRKTCGNGQSPHQLWRLGFGGYFGLKSLCCVCIDGIRVFFSRLSNKPAVVSQPELHDTGSNPSH